MSIKYLGIDNVKNIGDKDFRKNNGLDILPASTYLLMTSKVLYSDNYIVFTDYKNVCILQVSDIVELLATDKKYRNYLGVEDEVISKAIFDLNYNEKFTLDVLTSIYSNLANISLECEKLDDTYLLNHYLKKSNTAILRDILNDPNRRLELDPESKIQSYLATGLDKIVLKLRLPDTEVIYAYLNIQEDKGFVYPVIHIMDFEYYALKLGVRYQKHFIPIEDLNRLLYAEMCIVDVTKEDMLWSTQLCGICGFSKSTAIHNEICKCIKYKECNYDEDVEEIEDDACIDLPTDGECDF